MFDVFKKWLAQVENETCMKLKCLKSDNGDKYCDSRFKEFCINQVIKRVKMISENPHQNALAERMNMTILEHADTRRIAQAVLNRCSQHGSVSGQRRTYSASELSG